MKTMPQSTQEERYRWIRPVLESGVTIKELTWMCPFSTRSLKYWLARYRKHGLEGLKDNSRRPKSHPNETPIRIKERVLELRGRNKQCALKLKWDLAEEWINLHERTIGKFLKVEGLTRKYRVRKIKYKYVRVPLRVGDLIELDIKYVPKKLDSRRYYQFTAIDVATRWRYMLVYESASTYSALDFLDKLLSVIDFRIRAIKTDNDACFTNRYVGYQKSTDPLKPRYHAFDRRCDTLKIAHYLIDPGKPQQNGYVERSHRTDQESFYDIASFGNLNELRYKLRLWNMHYNDTKHCSLNGLTPNQALGLRVQNVRA